MTKDGIKKALLYCQDYDWDNCDDCPYIKAKNLGCCKEHMHDDALALITEQEQIIENLNGLVDYADKEIRKLRAEIKQAEIDALNELRGKNKKRPCIKW